MKAIFFSSIVSKLKLLSLSALAAGLFAQQALALDCAQLDKDTKEIGNFSDLTQAADRPVDQGSVENKIIELSDFTQRVGGPLNIDKYVDITFENYKRGQRPIIDGRDLVGQRVQVKTDSLDFRGIFIVTQVPRHWIGNYPASKRASAKSDNLDLVLTSLNGKEVIRLKSHEVKGLRLLTESQNDVVLEVLDDYVSTGQVSTGYEGTIVQLKTIAQKNDGILRVVKLRVNEGLDQVRVLINPVSVSGKGNGRKLQAYDLDGNLVTYSLPKGFDKSDPRNVEVYTYRLQFKIIYLSGTNKDWKTTMVFVRDNPN